MEASISEQLPGQGLGTKGNSALTRTVGVLKNMSNGEKTKEGRWSRAGRMTTWRCSFKRYHKKTWVVQVDRDGGTFFGCLTQYIRSVGTLRALTLKDLRVHVYTYVQEWGLTRNCHQAAPSAKVGTTLYLHVRGPHLKDIFSSDCGEDKKFFKNRFLCPRLRR